MLSGSFFANEISTRESLFKKKIDALEKSFSEKLNKSKAEITALSQDCGSVETAVFVPVVEDQFAAVLKSVPVVAPVIPEPAPAQYFVIPPIETATVGWLLAQPFESVTESVYVCAEDMVSVGEATVAFDNPVVGDQLYTSVPVPPVALPPKETVDPEQPLNVAEVTEAVNAVGLDTIMLLPAAVHPSFPFTTIT